MLRFTFLMLCGCFVQTTFYHRPEAQHLPSFPVGRDGARSRLPHLVVAWSSCLLLMAAGTRQGKQSTVSKRMFHLAAAWRRVGGKSDGYFRYRARVPCQ